MIHIFSMKRAVTVLISSQNDNIGKNDPFTRGDWGEFPDTPCYEKHLDYKRAHTCDYLFSGDRWKSPLRRLKLQCYAQCKTRELP